jgi:hypothetical protein
MTVGSTITNNGHKILINRAYKASPDYTVPSKIRIGADTSTPSVNTTALDRPLPIQGTEAVDSCDATTGWNNSTADTTIAVNASIYKEGTGSLSFAKTGATVATFGGYKTTTSRVFTSKDIWAWVYLVATTDLAPTGPAITLRFGSDSSNYYYKDFTQAQLQNGWNYLTFATGTATALTGSPDIANCDYTEIIFTAPTAPTTIAANRIVVDDIKLASADDYYKSFEGGYPIIDETLYQVTMRARLLTTDANGWLIDSIAWYNTDATELLHSVDVIIGESKSSTDELIFESVDRRVL